MQTILIQASKAAGSNVVASNETTVFSSAPVYEAGFWTFMFAAAKRPEHAAQVIEAMNTIAEEPCCENPRIWENVQTAKQIAKRALAH